MEPEKKKWDFLSNLHPLSIVVVIILLLALATYFIPGGSYDRYEVEVDALGGDTRELIDPDSFQYVESIPFVLVLVPLAVTMGFDSLVGPMFVHFSVSVGASAAFINPYNIGIGQALADLPMMSGIAPRIILWFVMMTATAAYILSYAFKVKKNPQLPICYENDLKKREEYQEMASNHLEGITTRGILVLLLVLAGFGLIIYGVLNYGWWFNEIGSVFLFMGIIIPLVGGLTINQTIEKILEGINYTMATMAGVDFFKYLKEAAKFVLIVYLPISVIGLILMTVFQY